MSSTDYGATDGFERIHAGKTVVVAGGTGNVGRVLVDSFLRAGATVVVPSRSEERLANLRGTLEAGTSDRLVTLQGDLGEERTAAGLVERVIGQHGPIHSAVASLGRFVPAPSLFEASLEDLEAVIDGYLVGHFVAARALVPRIEEGGSYTFINGPLAFQAMNPAAGLVSTVTAAQAMLARVLMDQVDDVRLNEVVLYTPFGWGDVGGTPPLSQREVGEYVVRLASAGATEVRGETLHLNSPEALRELRTAG